MTLPEKIKQIANSPAMVSKDDMYAFANIMELGSDKVDILMKAKSVIKKYYLSQPLSKDDESLIESAYRLLFQPDEAVQESIIMEKPEPLTESKAVPTESSEKPVISEHKHKKEAVVIEKEKATGLSIVDILKIGKKYKDVDDIYVGQDIPQNKMNNFNTAYGTKIKKPLIMIDCTVFGSAKVAIVITADGICWKGDWSCDIDKAFITWSELTAYGIEFNGNSITPTVTIGNSKKLDLSGSSADPQKVLSLLDELKKAASGKNGYRDEKKETTTGISKRVEPDISFTKSVSNPFVSMEKFVYDYFMFVSPVYAVVVHFANNHLGNIEDEDDTEEFKELAANLSDKNRLEQLILEAEKSMLNLFTESVGSTHQDIVKIVDGEIGSIFTYNEQVLMQMKQAMAGYRNILVPKMNEVNAAYQQLKAFLIHNEEGAGKFMRDFIKGGALGAMGASLFGPVGVALALGANYFGENEEEKKKNAIFDTLYENWTNAVNALYLTQAKEYYHLYDSFIRKIAAKYRENYELAYKVAVERGKKDEYEHYISEEISMFVHNKELIEMRNELRELENFFSEEE